MTKEELKELCSAKWGKDWKLILAESLEVSLRAVQYWASGTFKVSKPMGKLILRILND
jgi:hypothetical protein